MAWNESEEKIKYNKGSLVQLILISKILNKNILLQCSKGGRMQEIQLTFYKTGLRYVRVCFCTKPIKKSRSGPFL